MSAQAKKARKRKAQRQKQKQKQKQARSSGGAQTPTTLPATGTAAAAATPGLGVDQNMMPVAEAAPPSLPITATATTTAAAAASASSSAAPAAAAQQPASAEAVAWLNALTPLNILNPKIFDQAHVERQFRATYLDRKPFRGLTIQDFVDSAFLKKVNSELEQLNYAQKRNDLYEFCQSEQDLASISPSKFPLIDKLRKVLYGQEFRAFLEQVTGIAVTDRSVDTFAAVYQQGGHLLCHDDHLAGRRIAFILYLVPEDWQEQDGGALELYNVDAGTGAPTTVHSKIVPQWNTLSFFEVGPASYHRVAEVLTKDKNRVSIGGWFHGTPRTDYRRINPTELAKRTEAIDRKQLIKFGGEHDVKEDVASSASSAAKAANAAAEDATSIEYWISRNYRRMPAVKKIKKAFADESSVELRDFLKRERYEEVMAVLQAAPSVLQHQHQHQNGPLSWALVGPPNRREYLRGHLATAVVPDSDNAVVRLCAFMQSRVFRDYINGLTGVVITGGTLEPRKFDPGHYTLASDADHAEARREALDVVLCCLAAPLSWRDTMGGSIHYIQYQEDEELLTVYPQVNTLSIVYRAGAEPTGNNGMLLKFVKYVNHMTNGMARFDFSMQCRVEGDEDSSDMDDE